VTRSTVLVLALAACRVDGIDLAGKACPCPAGYVCDLSTNTCAHSATPGDGAPDTPNTTYDLTTGLQYYFKLDEPSGQSVVDSSPNANNGYALSATHTTWTAGKVGGALHFDGTGYSSYVIYPSASGTCGSNTLTTTGSFTAAAWVRFDSFKPYNGYTIGDAAMMHGTSGGMEGGWGLGATDGCNSETAAITVTNPSDQRINRCGTTALAADTWYHLTGVYNATARSLDLYVNGVIDTGPLTAGSAQVPTSINAPSAQCPYLAAASNQQLLLVGSLDEVRFYTRALTADEVGALYRASM